MTLSYKESAIEFQYKWTVLESTEDNATSELVPIN